MEDSFYSLRDLLLIVFKHKYKILMAFLAIVITVTIITFWLSPVYEATSSLLIKFGREYVYRSEVGDGNVPSTYFERHLLEVLNTEMEILKSRDLAEKIITALGVENLYPDLVAPPEELPILEQAVRLFQDLVKKVTSALRPAGAMDPDEAQEVVDQSKIRVQQ